MGKTKSVYKYLKVLKKLLKTTFSPFGIKEQQSLIGLHFEPLFIFGLLIRIYFIIFFTPNIHTEWFYPFVRNALNNINSDPWNTFLNQGGNTIAFPYGISMVGAYLPISGFGLIIDKLIGTNFLLGFGFRLTSCMFDYVLFLFLAILTKNFANRILLVTYWLSPLAIYLTYFHGQLDIIPITLLMGHMLS